MDPIFPDLEEKHVLITGGSNGIGAALCFAFAKQGSRVTILDFDLEAGNRLVNICHAFNTKVTIYNVDLTNTESICITIDKIKKELPPVQVIIANAGYDPRYEALEMTEIQWTQLFQLNVVHYFILCRELIPTMREAGGGSIIMTSSHTVWIAKPNLIAYNTSKAAIIGLARSLAESEGKNNIRVNAVAPGWIMTERQLKQWVTDEAKHETINKLQTLPIELTPESLVGTYLFLASNCSRPLTRQVLVADAGQAKGP